MCHQEDNDVGNIKPKPIMAQGGFEPPTHRASTCCSTKLSYRALFYTPYENRTHVTAVKRQCLSHLTNGAN